MKIPRRITAFAAVTALFGFAGPPALADIKDYEFQLVQNETRKGDTVVAVRLINKKTGKAVPDAVIITKRLDMAPEGMGEMATKIDQMPSAEPGVYRFQTNLSMEGRWQLLLGAKVQGEAATVQGKLILKATP
jgi:hypothetical protein